MHATTSGPQTATTAVAVTFTADECDYLFNSYVLAGFYSCADTVTTHNRIDREVVDGLRLAIRVSDALGVQDDAIERTIDDPVVLDALRAATASELDGLLGDDEYDGHDADTRPIGISIERKLGVDRFEIARRHGVPLDEHGTPADRRDSLGAQHTIAYYVRTELEKRLAESADALDPASRALIVAIAEATTAAGTRPIEVPA